VLGSAQDSGDYEYEDEPVPVPKKAAPTLPAARGRSIPSLPNRANKIPQVCHTKVFNYKQGNTFNRRRVKILSDFLF